MAKNKYYAIKEGNGVKNVIVTSWAECKSYVDKYPAEYKSFTTREQALEYLGECHSIGDTVPKITKVTKVTKDKKAKKGAKTVALNELLSVEVYEKFRAKAEELGVDENKLLIELITDYIEME